MIKSRGEFHTFEKDKKFSETALSKLDNDDLAFFRQSLDFDKKGNIVRAYFGDLDQKLNCSEDELINIASLFGIDKKRFKRTYNAFGDGQGNCIRRDFWWCPY